MTVREKILAALRRADGLCDDCLSEVTGVSPRQAINMSCRDLSSRRALTRLADACARCRRTKLVNRLRPSAEAGAKAAARQLKPVSATSGERPWFWEGNVQRRIVEFLVASGCSVDSTADTASRQHGKDIVARTVDGRPLWVTVKGFPEKSKNVQARHWFEGALHDLTRYRDEDPEAQLAMGLPRGFSTYEGLIKRNVSVRGFLGYSVYWVRGDGAVTVDRVSPEGER